MPLSDDMGLTGSPKYKYEVLKRMQVPPGQAETSISDWSDRYPE